MISIIISTYKEYSGGVLKRALNSVVAQTYSDWECIIVGDKSPFETEIHDVVKDCNDTRISFLNLNTHTGTDSPGTVPKIEGLKRSKGEYLAFLDADNEYEGEHLQECMDAFEAHPEVDVVYGDMQVRYAFLKFMWRRTTWNTHTKSRMMHSNFLDMSEPVFTRNAYSASGGLNKAVHASDWELWKSMIRSGQDHFVYVSHHGLTYYTASLMQFFEYFMLRLAQKSKIRYRSENLKEVQKIIQKRHARKHQ